MIFWTSLPITLAVHAAAAAAARLHLSACLPTLQQLKHLDLIMIRTVKNTNTQGCDTWGWLAGVEEEQLLCMSTTEMAPDQLAALSALTSLTEVRLMYSGSSRYAHAEAAELAAWSSLPARRLRRVLTQRNVLRPSDQMQLPLLLTGLTHLWNTQ
eukprot:gene920-1247_t